MTSRRLLAISLALCASAVPSNSSVAQNGANEARAPALFPEQELQERNADVRLRSRYLSLTREPAPASPLASNERPAAPTARIVRFEAPISPEQRIDLESRGFVLEEYLGGTTYLISSRTPTELAPLASALALDIDGVDVLRPEDKIRSLTLDLPQGDLSEREGRRSYLIEFLRVVEPDQARQDLASLGVSQIAQQSERTWVVETTVDQVRRLAELPSVKTIEAGPTPFLPLNEGGRRQTETDQAQRFSLGGPAPSFDGVTGAGVRIGIADSGVDQNHQDFNSVNGDGTSGASRVYNPQPGSGSHGTHVASIAAGNGFNAEANGHPALSLRGHAPQAEIGDYSQMGSTVASYHQAVVTDGTKVTNHSYVESLNGYGIEAANLDRIVRGEATHNGQAIPPAPQVWAAGNNGLFAQYGNEEGYYATFPSAKNTISVGSIDTRTGRLSNYSSLGPTFDGRIKPDVVAPGCNDSIASSRILAATSQTQGYIGQCGTSMAAPAVSGIIALVMEGYAKAFGSPPNARPSTYKAILVQTARDMVKTGPYPDQEFTNPDTQGSVIHHAGPDFATGYGLVDAEAARSHFAAGNRWREATAGQAGRTTTYCMYVPTGSAEVKATLAWDDEPGSTTTAITASKLVNDLDLELVSPDGSTLRPWTLDPLPVSANPGDGAPDPITQAQVVPARRAVDRRNNVEMANLALPSAGEWKLRVTAFNLPNGTAQAYSLAGSHTIRRWCGAIPGIAGICERFPGVCTERKAIRPIGGIDWGEPVPIDEICKRAVNCPGCEQGLCPGWRMDVASLPADARITLFNGEGDILYHSPRAGSEQTVRIRRHAAGTELFMLVTGRGNQVYERPLTPRLSVRDLSG